MLWDKSVRAMRMAAAAWVALVAVGAVLKDRGVLPGLADFEPYAWAISLGVIGFDSVGSLFVSGARRRRAEKKRLVDKALMGLLLNLSQRNVLRFEQMSASVFVPTWWSRQRAKLSRGGHDRAVLKRHRQYRPVGYPQQSGVTFASGKGVVGECWRFRKPQRKNLHALARQWSLEPPTPDQFDRIRKSTRMGFTFEDFVAVGSKYSEVIAEPIWRTGSDTKIIGVVSLDRPYVPPDDDNHDDYVPKLQSSDTVQQLAAVARVLSGILSTRSDEE